MLKKIDFLKKQVKLTTIEILKLPFNRGCSCINYATAPYTLCQVKLVLQFKAGSTDSLST